MTDTGLTVSQQAPAAPAAAITLDDTPLTQLHTRLLEDNPGLLDDVVRSIRDHAREKTPTEFLDVFTGEDVREYASGPLPDAFLRTGAVRDDTDQDDVEDAPPMFTPNANIPGLATRIARGDIKAAITLIDDVLPTLGQGRSPSRSVHLVPWLLGLGDDTVTISVVFDRSFWNLRRSQRADVLEYLMTFSRACDVRFLSSTIQVRLLERRHEDVFDVSATDTTSTPPATPIEECVEHAQRTLNTDSREVELLRALYDASSENLSYTALNNEFPTVGRERIRQVIKALRDLDLVATYAGVGGYRAELTPAGREYIETLDAEIGRQQRLEDSVSESLQSSPQAVYSAGNTNPPTGVRRCYRTVRLDRSHRIAAAEDAPEGTISYVDHPPDEGLGHRELGVNCEPDDDEALVSIRASGALEYIVSLARALASPKFLHPAFSDQRFEQLDEPGLILRNARGVGALSDEALDDKEVLVENLLEWEDALSEMTTDLHAGEYQDRDRLRSEIMRSAHGLAGTVVHLCDALGISVVRELRVPAGLDQEQLEELARAIALSLSIQSGYGVHNGFKNLFESREEKRRFKLGVDVDATAPYGGLIGGLCILGTDLHRLRPHLEDVLEAPAAVHSEAPEFAIGLDVGTPDRAAYARAITRVLTAKNLRPTREFVDLMMLYSRSPQAAARGIQRGLQPEDSRRPVRIDEARPALAVLDSSLLLKDAPPSVRDIVAGLLDADGPLSQKALAEAAGVSPSTVWRHDDVLEALEFVDRTSSWYSLVITPHSTEGRQNEDVLPSYIDSRERPWVVAERVANRLCPDGDSYWDATKGLGYVPGSDFPSFTGFLEELPGVEWWLRRLECIYEVNLLEDGPELEPPGPTTIAMGPTIAQAGLSSRTPSGITAP